VCVGKGPRSIRPESRSQHDHVPGAKKKDAENLAIERQKDKEKKRPQIIRGGQVCVIDGHADKKEGENVKIL
jgi:hypothetical protein